MVEETAPLLHSEKITNDDGTPSEYFLRQWQLQRDLNTGLVDIPAIIEAIEALQNIDLIAGVALAGGGNLSGPDRTFDLEDTAVTPGDYTNVDITVDQQGRITAIANGSGGGGSLVSSFSLDVGGSTVQSGTLFASKGILLRPYKDMTLTEMVTRINAVNTHEYMFGVYELSNTLVVTAVIGESTPETPVASGFQMIIHTIPASAMNAGTLYYLALTRTDGASNFALPIGVGDNEATEFQDSAFPVAPYPTVLANRASPGARIASTGPAVSDTILTGTFAAFLMGYIGSI